MKLWCRWILFSKPLYKIFMLKVAREGDLLSRWGKEFLAKDSWWLIPQDRCNLFCLVKCAKVIITTYQALGVFLNGLQSQNIRIQSLFACTKITLAGLISSLRRVKGHSTRPPWFCKVVSFQKMISRVYWFIIWVVLWEDLNSLTSTKIALLNAAQLWKISTKKRFWFIQASVSLESALFRQVRPCTRISSSLFNLEKIEKRTVLRVYIFRTI